MKKYLNLKLINKIIWRIINLRKKYLNHLQTEMIASEAKFFGKNSRIEYPCDSYNLQNISFGENFKAGNNLKIRTFEEFSNKIHSPEIIIKNDVSIETNCHISAINYIEIGSNVLIASNVYISDHNHGKINFSDIEIPPLKRELSSKGAIIIEDNVWLGENVIVLAGVRIGKNTIVGANSVVTKNLDENSIYVGIPAKKIIKNG